MCVYSPVRFECTGGGDKGENHAVALLDTLRRGGLRVRAPTAKGGCRSDVKRAVFISRLNEIYVFPHVNNVLRVEMRYTQV